MSYQAVLRSGRLAAAFRTERPAAQATRLDAHAAALPRAIQRHAAAAVCRPLTCRPSTIQGGSHHPGWRLPAHQPLRRVACAAQPMPSLPPPPPQGEPASSVAASSDTDSGATSDGEGGVQIDLQLPRRSLLVTFTCNRCDGRTERLVNPIAWERGMVIAQCATCQAWHKLEDAANLVEEIRYADLDPDLGSSGEFSE